MWLTMKTDCSVIAKRCQSTKKVLYAMFLKSEGPVVQVSIPKGRAITGHIYKNYVLNKVKKHNERNLHHSTKLKKIRYMFSFSLFTIFISLWLIVFFQNKNALVSQEERYASRNTLGSTIYQYMIAFPKKHSFPAWKNRLKLRVPVIGECFEGNHKK